MLYYLIVCRSLTYAQRTAAALERAGITAHILRSPKSIAGEGCSHSVKISQRHLADALRVLEEHTITRIGDDKVIQVDVRVIAATNRDLLQNVISGKFRDDLYYRLNVIKITIPNLSTRQGDVTLLAKHFLAQIAQSHGLERIRISPEAMEALNAYRWPGNVRQLKNTLESAFTNAENAVITLDSLPATIRENINYCVPNKGILQESEKMTIEAVLQRHGGNVSKAATELGISRTTLYNKISRFGITL